MVNNAQVTYDIVVPKGNWRLSSLSLTKKMYIDGPGTTMLYIEGDLSITGNGGITIAPDANLQLYMGGTTAKIAGSGINNLSGVANNFNYWGLPSNKSFTLQGNGDWIGTVYAPQAHAKFGGGGSSGDDFCGASVTASVTLGGHYKFHYDEATGVYGPRRGYTITSWNEL
jgi:hypothetical protein